MNSVLKRRGCNDNSKIQGMEGWMKQPSEMSDLEINMELAGCIHPNASSFGALKDVDELLGDSATVIVGLSDFSGVHFDYCNNIADIWPHVVGHKISISFLDGRWFSDKPEASGWPIAESSEPIRALAECLLLILRDKGEKQ